MTSCAYCGEWRPGTKEHIWPSALINKYEKLHTYNPKTDKFYVGDPVIKDVCAICNNERLSLLDSYLSELYDAYFERLVEPGESVSFKYNYENLLRALLKISYNSSRATGNKRNVAAHQRFVRYVLSGGYCAKLALRLQVVTKAKGVSRVGESDIILRPTALRCATLAYTGTLEQRFMVRLVGINSFWFYLVLPCKDEPDHKWAEFLRGFTTWATPSGVPLQRCSESIHIPVERTTYMHPTLLGSLLRAGRS